MNFIISAIGLILFHLISQSESSPEFNTVIVKFPEIEKIFNSISRDMYNKLKNLFASDTDLCNAVQKSNFFEVDYNQVYPYDDQPELMKYLEVSRSYPASYSRYKEPRPIQDILEIVDFDNHFYSEGYTLLGPDSFLRSTVCTLSQNKHIYISDGVRVKGITMQFLLGKDRTSEYYPKVLAAIGKSVVAPRPGIFDFYTLSRHIINSNFEERRRIFTKRNKCLTSMQRIWLGAAVKDYEVKKEYGRKNFNMIILYTTPNLVLYSFSGQYDPFFIPPQTPYMLYTIKDLDNLAGEEALFIVPNYTGENSTYFYGFEKLGVCTLQDHLNIIF